MSGDPHTEEEQPAPQEISTPISKFTPMATLEPTPTPKGLNHFKQGEKYLWQDENYVKAVESFTEYIKLNENDAKGYERRGNSYQELRRYQEALMDYDKAIELNTESSGVYGKRGNIYGDLGKYEEAIKDYDKWLKLDPEALWPHLFKGWAYMQLEQYEVAIQNWETYVELRLIESADWIESEQAANAYTNIGLAYVELGQYHEAITHFDTALVIDAAYPGAISGKEKAVENLR
jgi:tetratricopeptide (TPR) repeat protein